MRPGAARLTPKQARVLDCLTRWVQEQGYPPTFQELAHALHLTVKNARDSVLLLERKGYLRRQPHVARGMTVLTRPATASLLELLLIGRVMAGQPVEVFEAHEPMLIPPMRLRTGPHVVMQVMGDSMIDDGIREGDLVIVQPQTALKHGETVVVVVRGEATIKRYYRRGTIVELRPANATMASLEVEVRDVAVKGVVAGLMRKYEHGRSRHADRIACPTGATCRAVPRADCAGAGAVLSRL
jgi:repressor LexA